MAAWLNEYCLLNRQIGTADMTCTVLMELVQWEWTLRGSEFALTGEQGELQIKACL